MDIIEKEPLSLLFKLFISGVVAVFLTLIISDCLELVFPVLSEESSSIRILLLQNFLGVALIEEFSKWIFLLVCSWKNKNFNFLFDGIVYAVFVSLGFATFENIGAMLSVKTIFDMFLRAFISVPAHAFFGVAMGFYYGLARKKKNRKESYGLFLIFSLLIPILLHGFFDFCLAMGSEAYFLVFVGFVILLYIYSFKTVRKMSNRDHHLSRK